MCIPVIGWIAAVIMALGKKGSVNSRNLARAMLILIIAGIVVFGVIFLLLWIWSVKLTFINLPGVESITFGFQ